MQAIAPLPERLVEWLESHAGLTEAKLLRPLDGGNANVTNLIETSGGLMVLRHPPTETVSDLAGAGIAREFRFASAIADKAPVAEPVIFCDDTAILGVPFSVSRFVEGKAITDRLPVGYSDTLETRNAIGHALIDALASFQSIDPVPAGLGNAEKGRSFVERQVIRWRDVRSKHSVRDLAHLDELASWLLENAPTTGAIRIVHCDYHLDNVLMDPRLPKVNAIIDWEMATVADPLVDVGLVTAMWNRDERRPLGFAFVQRISNQPKVVSGDDLAARWASSTGLSIARLRYFQAFSLWRLAAIVEGAYVLFRKGQIDGAYERGLKFDVPALLEAAVGFASEEGFA